MKSVPRTLTFLPSLLLAAIGLMFLWSEGNRPGAWWPLGSEEVRVAVNTKQLDALALTLRAALPLPESVSDVDISSLGSADRLKALEQDQADVAFVRTGLPVEYNKVQVLSTGARYLVHLAVPAESTILTFRDLAGKRVGAGPVGTDANLLARQVISYLHFGEEPVLVEDHAPSMADALARGEIDAAFLLEPLLSPGLDEFLATGYYRLVPIPEAEAIGRVLPGVEADTVPGNVYGPERSIPPADGTFFPTLAVDSVVVARPDAPQEGLQALLAKLLSLQPAATLGVITFGLPPAEGFQGLAAHPAALAAARLQNPVSTDDLHLALQRLVGWGLLLLALLQALQVWNQWLERKQRRKMVEWFELVQDIGARMEVAEGPVELGRLVDDLASKQRLAERGYVTGKLSADELMLFTAAHQTRVLDALSKHGHALEAPAAPAASPHTPPQPSIFSSYAGAIQPDDDDSDRSITVVRPDYGEALINTVRVRRRESAPAESIAYEAQDFRVEQNSVERQPWPPSTSANPSTEEAEEPGDDSQGETDTSDRSHRKRRRGGRGRNRARGKDREDPQPAPPPSPSAGLRPGPTQEEIDQMDLFGRKG